MSLLTSGWLGRPVSRRVRARRSTVAMMAAFVGLGALWLQVRTLPDDPTPEPAPVVTSLPLATTGS